MLIYFSGNNFKYEIEAVAKLFFPVKRFSHIYNDDITNLTSINKEGEFIFTRKKVLFNSNSTLLWVCVNIFKDNKFIFLKKSVKINNDILDYNDECERNLAVLMYLLLQEITNITPKWGVLTGVRPVSLIQKYIKLGLDKLEIFNYFQSKFLVTPEKLELSYITANIQLDILNSIDQNSYSLYVAIPFCKSKCSYCSFVSHPIKDNDIKVDKYIDLLILELEKTAVLADDLNLNLATIYIGGGTPTALNELQLEKLVNAIKKYFPINQATEYTIEAGRVDTITKEKLLIIKNAWGDVALGDKTKVRISINPQTFNDQVLQKIGRNHSADDVIQCYNLALDLGFEFINMDFIVGLPLDNFESFKRTIDIALKLSPNNITVHTLSIKRSSDLFKSALNSFDNNFDEVFMNDYAQKVLTENGYLPYYLYRQKNTLGNLENVGYSKSVDSLCIYNIYIMEEIHSIIACGAGGVTKIIKNSNQKPITRIFNFKYHHEYISRFDEILQRKEECRLMIDSNVNKYNVQIINDKINSDKLGFIKECEEKYYNQIINASKIIMDNMTKSKIVLLSGPSGSTKTTTSTKITEELSKHNISSVVVSLDNFFIDRDFLPLLPNGDRDFESVKTLDMPLLQKCLHELLVDKVSVLPVFDFPAGKRSDKTQEISLKGDTVVIIEGIHAINPKLTMKENDSDFLKIYVSPNTDYCDNDGNILISSRDTRLIRRLVRDYFYRGNRFESTFEMWVNVVASEIENIIPYSKNADILIDTSIFYEPCIFARYVKELDSKCEIQSEQFQKQLDDLLLSLSKFIEISRDLIPNDTVLHEFIK